MVSALKIQKHAESDGIKDLYMKLKLFTKGNLN